MMFCEICGQYSRDHRCKKVRDSEPQCQSTAERLGEGRRVDACAAPFGKRRNRREAEVRKQRKRAKDVVDSE